MKKLALLICLACICCLAQAQIKMPAPSPLNKSSQMIGLAEVSLTYSRPSAKGRTIFGDIVPFDKIWRTGANRPTKIKFDEDMSFEGNKVAKGEYTLITIPGKTEWTILLNKDSKGNGAFSYEEADNVANFKVKSMSLPNKVETFTIAFTDLTINTAMLEISWEKTAVRIKIENDADAKVMADIKKQLDPAKDAGTYFEAASYYYETNRETQKALELINKSLEWNPNRFWVVHLKAKIQARLNDKAGAIATAEQSKKMSAEAKNDDYVKMNDKLIAELKK